LYVGLAAGTVRSWRRTWPPLALVGAAAYLVNLPWRVWWGDRHLPEDPPLTVGLGQMLSHLHRGWASFHLVLRLLFSYEMWLVLTPLAVAAAIACLTLAGRARETAIIYLVTSVLAVCGFTYALWSAPIYRLIEATSATPATRAVGSIVLFSTVLAPLLIAPLIARRQMQGARQAGPPERSGPAVSS
jgi:hypothetical protein